MKKLFLSIGVVFLLNINETKNQINNNLLNETKIIENENKILLCNKLLKNIKSYNTDIKKETILFFLNTIENFNIAKNEEEIFLLVSQLLSESGFQQHYSSNHKKRGQLVKSHSNAIGITQITPNTAYYYLRKANLKNEKYLFSNINFSKEFKKHKPNKNQIKFLENWLSNEKNNIELWGYIIKNLRKDNNFEKTFVAYNAGSGFLKRFLSKNKNPNNFPYVKKIRQIKKGLLN
jgi:hypothetical protein